MAFVKDCLTEAKLGPASVDDSVAGEFNNIRCGRLSLRRLDDHPLTKKYKRPSVSRRLARDA